MTDWGGALFTIFLVFVILAAIWWFSTTDDPFLELTSAMHKGDEHFKRYVRLELYKAQEGASNAEQWAVDLVAAWKRNQEKNKS